jgi:phosphate starvation-inducible PhoH-like protein
MKIFLVRPAIEAGEKLGFLPGDLSEKVNPYLQPIYDALDDVLGAERVSKLIEKKVIEIAPLAYMRGRTLNDAFILLDEGQNTTIAQMEMFLTRIGFGSKAVVTGDTSQIDLPRDSRSGLKDCLEFMPKINGAHITKFKPNDVMRHKIVKDIIKEYDKRKK